MNMTVEEYSDEAKHLFLLCPNNSGSTFVQEAFRSCKSVAVLDDEGQFTPGFQSEISSNHDLNFIFTLKPRLFENQKMYNEWHANEYYWNEVWNKNNPNAKWKFEKSPPNILRPHLILDCFVNVSFIIMVRNPYAMAESILRANPKASIQDIGNHVLNCLTIQRKNCYLRGNNLIFTYEDMCNRPEWVEQQVKDKFKIEDFSLSANKKHGKISKNGVHNYNDEQISKLKKYHIDELNKIFMTASDMLDFWGYKIIDNFSDNQKTEVNGFDVKEIFEYDISKIKEIILSLPEEDWFKFEVRNESYKEHSHTHAICLYSDPDEDDVVYAEQIKNEEMLTLFSDELKKLHEKYSTIYKKGTFSRILFTRMNEDSKIPTHCDNGKHLRYCRRTHIPIVTNSEVDFCVDGKVFNLEENKSYEFDNTRMHSVYNNSNQKRVHLIIDWKY